MECSEGEGPVGAEEWDGIVSRDPGISEVGFESPPGYQCLRTAACYVHEAFCLDSESDYSGLYQNRFTQRISPIFNK